MILVAQLRGVSDTVFRTFLDLILVEHIDFRSYYEDPMATEFKLWAFSKMKITFAKILFQLTFFLLDICCQK